MNVSPCPSRAPGRTTTTSTRTPRHTFNVDNDTDGVREAFDINFTTELRGATTALGLPLSYSALNERAR